MPGLFLRKVGARATGLGYPTAVTCTPDGEWAVFGMVNTEVVFCALNGTPRVESIPHRGIVAALSRDGRYIASGIDERVYLCEAASGANIRGYGGHENAALVIAFSPDGSQFAVGGKYELVLHPTDREAATYLVVDVDTVDALAFLDDGKTLLSGAKSGRLTFWDVETAKETARLSGHTGRVRSLAATSDGSRVASGAEDGSVRIWDTKLRTQISSFEGLGSVHSVAFSNDERLLLVGSSVGMLTLIDLATGDRVSETFGPTTHPLLEVGPYVAVVPGQNRAVTTDMVGDVWMWEYGPGARGQAG
jgi:WD40 repeat protein